MNIALVASEAIPFAKTGGLADVAGTLPKHFEHLGVDACVFLPLYRAVRKSGLPIESMSVEIKVPMSSDVIKGHVWRSRLPEANVTVYLIGRDSYFDRPELYGGKTDYEDNCERFTFFSRGVIEAIRALGLKIDVIHANDWQTALIPVYLKTLYKDDVLFRKTASLFTIHNLAYQGKFWHWDLPITGLDWSLFNMHALEFYGKLNFLKGGIVFADAVSTVSQRYAQEIMGPEFGCQLDAVLKTRQHELYGILNGIDPQVWNPAVDEKIPARYTPEKLDGKAVCKEALQKQCKLPVKPDVPILGFIGRLADQKGVDLIAAIVEHLMQSDLQLVVLGTGQQKYHTLLTEIAAKYPTKASINLTFNDALAHLIEAGSDMFLMPSRYEPCGLNQMYSLAYGTVPIVRATGGLADTVTNYMPEKLSAGWCNGFVFQDYAPEALLDAIQRALKLYVNRADWVELMKIGMKQDWSWARSAGQYVDLYKKVKAKADRRPVPPASTKGAAS